MPVAVALAPADVHAHEHGRPVVALGAAGSRIDLEDSPEIVAFLAEHIAQLQVLDLTGQSLELGIGILLGRLVLAGEFYQDFQVLVHFPDFVVGVSPEFHSGHFLKICLGLLRVVPESGPGTVLLHFSYLLLLRSDVKDTSPAYRYADASLSPVLW